MKKSICFIVLMIGMSSIMVYAQSDNASALVTRGEGTAGVIWESVYGVFTGPVTIVATPSGNLTISWTGQLVEEGTEELKTPYKESLTDYPLFFVWERLECQITPGYVAQCVGHTTAQE